MCQFKIKCDHFHVYKKANDLVFLVYRIQKLSVECFHIESC